MKKVLTIMALFIISILTVSMVNAAALPVSIDELKVNGNSLSDESLYVQEGKTLKIEIKVKNTGISDVEDVEVEAAMKGYEYSKYESVSDSTSLFDLDKGDSRWVTLDIKLPVKLDKDLYLLRVRVTDKNSDEVSKTFNLKVNPSRHGLDIKDVVFSPSKTVKAGYSLLTSVLIDNYGGKDENDVKVTLSIPGLGISTSDYISKIDSDDKKTSEELFLKVPLCAKKGTYDAKVTLNYDNYGTVTKNYQLSVLANEKCSVGASAAGKLILTVGPESQNMVAGKQAVYPFALTNAGTETKTYVLGLTSGSWATSKLSDNLVVLAPGKTKVAYAYLTPSAKATTGQNLATLTVSSGNSVLKTVYLKANVVTQAKKSLSLRNGLEIALVILVVILVIVGLILGFSRLRKDEDDEVLDEEGKAYY